MISRIASLRDIACRASVLLKGLELISLGPFSRAVRSGGFRVTDYNADAASFQRWLRNHGHAATAELRGGSWRNIALEAALRSAFNAGGQDRASTLSAQLLELARATIDALEEPPGRDGRYDIVNKKALRLASAALAGEDVTT